MQTDERKAAIERLTAVKLNGGSHENLSAIAQAIMPDTTFGWTVGACERLRDTLVDLIEGGWDAGFDEGYASADDWWAEHEQDLEEHGWVRLPVGIDGETIRIGDTVRQRLMFSGESMPLTVDRMELSRGRDGYRWTVATDADGSCWVQPTSLRHHRPPTVEDVLREFALACEDAGNAGPEVERIAADYAKRLRLAESEES